MPSSMLYYSDSKVRRIAEEVQAMISGGKAVSKVKKKPSQGDNHNEASHSIGSQENSRNEVSGSELPISPMVTVGNLHESEISELAIPNFRLPEGSEFPRAE